MQEISFLKYTELPVKKEFENFKCTRKRMIWQLSFMATRNLERYLLTVIHEADYVN